MTPYQRKTCCTTAQNISLLMLMGLRHIKQKYITENFTENPV